MEELLTGLLVPDLAHLTDRASTLTQEAIAAGATGPDPSEMAATAAAVRHRRRNAALLGDGKQSIGC
jgi:hypothetical protein